MSEAPTRLIPILTCFDDNYVIPAAAAFQSMLTHADAACHYHIYVLHDNISPRNQQRLQTLISRFANASAEFIVMKNNYGELWESLKFKGHFSKEIFYKFVPPSLFPQLDKIIITDVDVIFANDVAPSYLQFDPASDDYLAAVKRPLLKGSWLENHRQTYSKYFSSQECDALCNIGAGYMILNLRKCRQDNIESKLIDFVLANQQRLQCPEQDAFNFVCRGHISLLPLRTMACTYLYDLYQTPQDLQNDLNYSAEEIAEALANPIQIHYATAIKPWNELTCSKSGEWIKYLQQTEFFNDWHNAYQRHFLSTTGFGLLKPFVPFLKLNKLLLKLCAALLPNKFKSRYDLFTLRYRKIRNIYHDL